MISLKENVKEHSENILGQFMLEYKESYGYVCLYNEIISFGNGDIKCEIHFRKESLDNKIEETPYIEDNMR
jgi:hypothetical protein